MTAYRVAVDWNASGSFADSGDDVTARVLDGRSPLTMQYGRDQNRALSPIGPGEAHFALNNISRDYSPENGSSPLAGNVVPGRDVLATVTGGPVVVDPFGRTVAAGGWGTADSGGAWTVAGGASDFSVSSGAGRISLGSVSVERTASLPVAVADVDLAATFTTSAVAAGGPVNGYLVGRRADDNNRYLARLDFDTTGVLFVGLEKFIGGSPSGIGPLVSTGITYAANTAYRLRFQITGSTVRARAWAATSVEPSTWHASQTDTSLTAAGSAGVRAILSSGNTNSLPVTVTVDDFTVLNLGAQVLLSAQLDDMTYAPDYNDRYLSVDCIDALGALRGNQVSTGLYQGLRTGEAIGILLDAAGVPATSRVLDTGATVMPWWWLDKDDAYDALMDLLASEGPPALVTVDTSGRIVFSDRHHRLRNAQSTTVQSTWRSSGTEPLISSPADYNHGWKEIINSVTFDLPIRSSTGAVQTVWSNAGLLSIPAGATFTIVAQAADPFYNAVPPVADTDFTIVSGGVSSVTLSRTSGQSTEIRILASTATVIADLSLRAVPVTTAATIQIKAEDASSVAKYGRRTLPDGRTPQWASPGDARGICSIILGQRGDRLPTVRVTMKSANTARLVQQLTRDLSDRVHVVEDHTGLDADCFIEQMAHSITGGGTDHQTTFGLEKAPAQIATVFILGSATNGVLGTNRLGRTGLQDAATVFVLGSATNGVLGSNLLAA